MRMEPVFVFLERGGVVLGSLIMVRMSMNEYFQRWTVRGYCGEAAAAQRSDVAALIGRRRTWRMSNAKTESFRDGNHPML